MTDREAEGSTVTHLFHRARLLSMAAAILGVGLSSLVVSTALAQTSDPAASTPPAPAPVGHPPPAWGFEGPYRLAITGTIGFAPRADDPPLFRATNDAGILGGVGLRLLTSERVAFGLGYEHLGLWREESGLLANGTFELARGFDTLWGSLRLRPAVGEELAAFVDLGVGPSWQRASLQGFVWDPVTPGSRAPIRCDTGGSLGFGLRAQAGMEAIVTESFSVELSAGLDLYRHSSDVIGACAPGAGTAVVPGLRLTFAYGWGL